LSEGARCRFGPRTPEEALGVEEEDDEDTDEEDEDVDAVDEDEDDEEDRDKDDDEADGRVDEAEEAADIDKEVDVDEGGTEVTKLGNAWRARVGAGAISTIRRETTPPAREHDCE
jgi:hypothetical protein